MKNPIRIASSGFVAWCNDPSPAARLERTVFQGVLGVGAAVLVGLTGAPEWAQGVAIPATMAVISPIQAALGKSLESDEPGIEITEEDE